MEKFRKNVAYAEQEVSERIGNGKSLASRWGLGAWTGGV